MVILPRQSLVLPVCGLVLVGVLIGLLVPAPVRADVGPQPVLPGGSSIKPGDETPIQMAAEVVTMNVRLATEADNALVKLNPDIYGYGFQPVWFVGIAEVEANFTMKNPTSEAVSLTAWFPLASALENLDWSMDRYSEIVPRITSFQVSVDGNPQDYAVSELPNPKGADKFPLPWASFPVTFPGGKETAIHVSYMVPLQPSVKANYMALYYIFQTGAGWAGPIGRAELILNLPYPASAGTLSVIPPGGLYLPPMYVPTRRVDLPPGAVLEGNQVRWTWKDFEPGPQDDFEVWLLQPGKWQELETARAAVQAHPQEGRAWLDLASTYYFLAFVDYWIPSLFSSSYIPPAIAGYHKAADLLPEHPAPHAGLALLNLAQYFKDKNAPPKVLQYVQDEYQIAKELDAKNPSLLKEAGISGGLLESLEEALYSYFYEDTTATVAAATQVVLNATQTIEATLNYATSTARAIAKATFIACRSTPGVDCDATASSTATPTKKLTLTSTPTSVLALTATPTRKLALTATLIPSTTPQPPPTTPPTTAETTGNGQSPVLIVAAIVIGLVVVGYLALKRLRKSAGK